MKNKNLIQLPAFWIVNSFIIIVSIILSMALWTNERYEWDFSAVGFKTFIEAFALPLGILAIVVPASALIASIHRSEQTRKQIDLMTETNRFSNYYKHIEEFEKHLERCNLIKFVSYDLANIYNISFPASRSGDYNVNREIVSVAKSQAQSILTSIKEANEHKYTYRWFINKMIKVRLSLDDLITIKFKYNDNQTMRYQIETEIRVYTIPNNLRLMMEELQIRLLVMNAIIEYGEPSYYKKINVIEFFTDFSITLFSIADFDYNEYTLDEIVEFDYIAGAIQHFEGIISP